MSLWRANYRAAPRGDIAAWQFGDVALLPSAGTRRYRGDSNVAGRPSHRCHAMKLMLLVFAVFAADSLTVSEFRTLHRQLQPRQDEAWRTIPWKVSLLEAQRAAAREKKPIFVWAMDGHPLGCT